MRVWKCLKYGCICMSTSSLGSSLYFYDETIKCLFLFFPFPIVLFHTCFSAGSKEWSSLPGDAESKTSFVLVFQHLRNVIFWDGEKSCHLLTNEMWNWMNEDSFRETAESYTGLDLITKLISAHLRSHSDYFYHTFALLRGCSITSCKQSHRDWPTSLVRWVCALLPFS